MSLPSPPLRLLPTAATFVGWDSHPLEFRAFSRRTRESMVLIHVESVESLDAINARSDLDVVFLGPCDLSQSLAFRAR